MALSIDDQKKLIEAQVKISESLQGIREVVTKLNDQNVLHTTTVEADHKWLKEKLQILTDKYWWLIIALIFAIIAIMGYKDIASKFIT